MNLFKKKKSQKLTKFEKKRKRRLIKNAATTQNSLKYVSNFQSGLMNIVDEVLLQSFK